MIIKRSLRSQMPSIKRCKLEGPALPGSSPPSSDSDATRRRKRCRDGFPLELLGHVSGLPYLPSTASWCSDLSFCSPAELPPRDNTTAAEAAPPPPAVVRTLRGRAQALPSRFRDSVLIDPWKKDKPKPKPKHKPSEDELIVPKPKKFTYETYKNPSLRAPRPISIPKSISLTEEEECYRACRNLGAKKYSLSCSTLTSLNESLAGAEEKFALPIINLEEPFNDWSEPMPVKRKKPKVEESVERGEDFYWPKDFVSGDIVWAKSGKYHPSWPAIVINPMQQAPESVLHSCVSGALCVMYFGYSRNANERIIIGVITVFMFTL